MRVSIILFVLLAITTGLIVNQERKIDQLQVERQQLISFATRDSAAAATYRNKLGHQVTQTEISELSRRNAEDLLNTQRLSWIKELEGVKSNLKNIENAVKVQALATADLKMQLRDTVLITAAGDTVRAHNFDYADKYDFYQGVLEGDTTVMVRARISVPLEGALFWQRRRILGLRIGRKQWSTEYTSPNEWVTISGVDFIKIQKR